MTNADTRPAEALNAPAQATRTEPPADTALADIVDRLLRLPDNDKQFVLGYAAGITAASIRPGA